MIRLPIQKLRLTLEAIKFEHTVFALPFALTSALLANGLPPWQVVAWILVAMVTARTAAMAVNRIVDLPYDRKNPRTQDRALVTGKLRVLDLQILTVVSVCIFVLAAWRLNPLAFALSPVALAIILGYSYTKRFTNFSHVVLGLALGIAPMGAWIAVTGRFEMPPVILSAAVMCWTAGFDIIYALQDIEFDQRERLFSIPASVGPVWALKISRAFHAVSVLLLVAFGLALGLGILYYIGVAVVGILLVWEQWQVKPDDLSRVNVAFFNVNGLVSFGYLAFAVADAIARKALF